MCQLLGISYVKPSHFNKSWDKFRIRADRNPDGWGLAYGDSNGLAVVKQPDRADRSFLAASISMAPLPALVMIGHIRLATRGEPALVNTHPFFARAGGRDWAMVHNGHLSGYNTVFAQYGQTDSEAFFIRLTWWLNKTAEVDPYNVAEYLVNKASEAGMHGKLNFLLTDGEHLYAHSNIQGTLYLLQTNAGTIFCSQPLTRQRGWKPIEVNRVHVFRDGGFIYRTNKYQRLKEEVI